MNYLEEVFRQTADGGYFDFARCERKDGTHYGTGGTCRIGRKVGAAEEPQGEASGKKGGVKVGTEKRLMALSPDQLKQLRDDPRLYDYQRKKIDDIIAKKGGSSSPTETLKAKPTLDRKTEATPKPKAEPSAKPQAENPAPAVKPGQMEVAEKKPSKVSDEKVKETFDRAIARYEDLKAQEKALRDAGATYKDPRIEQLSNRRAAAEQAIRISREAYHALDRDEFLKAAGEEVKASKDLRKAMDDVRKARENPLGDPKILENAYDYQREVGSRVSAASQRKTAAYFGEPQITTNKPDGGGQVSSAVPSSLPKGGADKALKDYLDGSQIVMQQTPANLSKIVESGEALNMFQAGKSGIGGKAESYRTLRIEGELKSLGVARDVSPDQRPLYAALDNPDRTRSLSGSGTMPQYGGVSMVLKPEVKDRATFTMGDSLDDATPRGMKASPIRDPAQPKTSVEVPGRRGSYTVSTSGNGSNSNNFQISEANTPNMKYTPPYTEAQIFGGLKTSDIQEVRVYQGHNVSSKVVKALQEQGVRVVQLPPQMNNIRLSDDDEGFNDITAINTKSL